MFGQVPGLTQLEVGIGLVSGEQECDLVLTTTLPDEVTIERIVASSLVELAGQWSELAGLAGDTALHAELAKLLVGLDGRRVRKAVLGALSIRPEVALDPTLLTVEDLRDAVAWAGRA